LKIDVSNVWKRNNNSKGRIVVNQGGTRSSKTYSICQMIALWLLTGEIRNKPLHAGTIDVVRKTLPALKASALKDFREIINNFGLRDLQGFKENKTDLIFQYRNREVCFFSTDDEQKLRGRKRNVLYCNEANELEYIDFVQLNFRTTDFILLDFNPSDPFTWIKDEILDKRMPTVGDVDLIKSTYLDNKFLNAETIREIELLRDTDPDFWSIYGLGDFTKIRGIVYDNWAVVAEMPAIYESEIFGLDLGFANDPTALVRVVKSNGRFFVELLLYQTGVEIDELAEILKTKCKNRLVISDHDPAILSSYKKKGIKIVNALKHKGINHGIQVVRKQGAMYIHRNSQDLINEIKKYKYRLVNETPTNDPIDKFNHALDAVRYAVTFLEEKGNIQQSAPRGETF